MASALTVLERKQILAREEGIWAFVDPAFRLWVTDRVARARGLG